MIFAPKPAGRIVGALFLSQMLVGIYINFSLLQPLTGEPGFLVAGAASSAKFGLIALLALAIASFNLIIAAIGYRIFSRHNPLLAILVLAFPVVSLALTGVEYAHVMELVSYSQAYQGASVADQALLATLRPVVAASRNWAHFMAIGVSGFSLFLFYLMLLRSSAAPRRLVGFGVLAAALQVMAVSQAFVGNGVPVLMLLPLALAQLLLPLYFIVRGIAVRADLAA